MSSEQTDLGLSELWQPLCLLFLGSIRAEDGVDEGIVHVAHDRHRGVNLG
jgi:hypothetical protein